MKKIIAVLSILFLTIINPNISKSDSPYGEGQLQLTEGMVDYFIKYISNPGGRKYPSDFYVTIDGTDGTYWTCSQGANCAPGSPKTDIKQCESLTGKKCKKFARLRTIKWKNGINPAKGKAAKFSKKMSDQEFRDKLNKLGFYKNNFNITSSNEDTTQKKNTDNSSASNSYSLKGERAIALSWKGYSDLIAGIIDFDEKNYKGNINLDLPNNDGSCEGNYILQKGGKGTWQLSCSNNMGASGTLKWIKDGSVTGKGLDFNDNKVTFTVSSKS